MHVGYDVDIDRFFFFNICTEGIAFSVNVFNYLFTFQYFTMPALKIFEASKRLLVVFLQSNGWDANEMFRYNEVKYGVTSTYDSSLSMYT